MNCARSFTAHALRPSASASPAVLNVARVVQSRAIRTRGPRKVSTAEATEGLNLRTLEGQPFQTFQLALEVIKKDNAEKVQLIKEQREKIAELLKKEPNAHTPKRLRSMNKHLEYLRVQADINNPRVKYNFDRGIIGLHKPIYRFLMNRKWREYRRPVLMQRLTQMNVVPDLLPKIDPVVDVQVRFRGRDVQPGAFVESLQSNMPPTFKVIPFEAGEMLCTVAIVDIDVPVIGKDSFDYRLHWLVSNIKISPKQTQAVGTTADPSDTVMNWLPPHVQKGSPYHRYAMIVLKQPGRLDADKLKAKNQKRDGFILRGFQAKNQLETIGAFMWRGQWDEGTKQVMQENGLEGWDKMLVRRKEEK